MLDLSLKYKKRLLELAGINFSEIISEAISDTQRISSLAKSHQRVPFNSELMKQAIAYGLEVGLSYKSDNDKYTMPMTKMRTIQPVALGRDKDGQIIFRGYHKVGQSEIEAIKTGVRSAEAEDEWRLFKAGNTKGMWFTGEMFNVAPPGFNPNGDKAMVGGIEIAFNPSIAIANQKVLEVPQSPVATSPTPASPRQAPSKGTSPGTGDETLY